MYLNTKHYSKSHVFSKSNDITKIENFIDLNRILLIAFVFLKKKKKINKHRPINQKEYPCDFIAYVNTIDPINNARNIKNIANNIITNIARTIGEKRIKKNAQMLLQVFSPFLECVILVGPLFLPDI